LTISVNEAILNITVRAKGNFKMHINDVFVLRDVLSAVRVGMRVDMVLVQALLEAADEEVKAWEQHMEELALAEEARQQ